MHVGRGGLFGRVLTSWDCSAHLVINRLLQPAGAARELRGQGRGEARTCRPPRTRNEAMTAISFRRLAVVLPLCAALASCAPAVGVKALRPEQASRALTANILNSGNPSE